LEEGLRPSQTPSKSIWGWRPSSQATPWAYQFLDNEVYNGNMKKRIKAIIMLIIASILAIIILRFYILPTPNIYEYLIGAFLLVLFLASFIYWVYYGFKRYILRKHEKEFDPTQRLQEIADKHRDKFTL